MSGPELRDQGQSVGLGTFRPRLGVLATHPIQYQAPANAAVSAPYYDQLTNVENGKNPDAAWAAAVSQAKLVFQQQQAT